jgi:hypothetical protein
MCLISHSSVVPLPTAGVGGVLVGPRDLAQQRIALVLQQRHQRLALAGVGARRLAIRHPAILRAADPGAP